MNAAAETDPKIIRSNPARGLNDGQLWQFLEKYSIPVLIAVERNIVRATKLGRLYLRPDSPIPRIERLRLYQYAAAWMHLDLSDFELTPDGRMAAWTRGWWARSRVLVSYEQKAEYLKWKAANPGLVASAEVEVGAAPGYYWNGSAWVVQPQAPSNMQGINGPYMAMVGAAQAGDWKAIVSLSIVAIVIWRLSVLTSGQGGAGGWSRPRKKERVGRPSDWLNTPTEEI